MGPVIASGNASGNGREPLNSLTGNLLFLSSRGIWASAVANGCAEVSVILSMPSLRLAAAVLGN